MNCVSEDAMVMLMPFDCSPRTSTGYTATREVASSDEVSRISSSKPRTLRNGSIVDGIGLDVHREAARQPDHVLAAGIAGDCPRHPFHRRQRKQRAVGTAEGLVVVVILQNPGRLREGNRIGVKGRIRRQPAGGRGLLCRADDPAGLAFALRHGGQVLRLRRLQQLRPAQQIFRVPG